MFTPGTIRDTILANSNGIVSLIVLFGSRARGDEHSQSDWDVAVLTDISDSRKRWNLLLSLSAALNGPNDRVDIVTIEDADWGLRFRIARDGVVLYERDNAWCDFVEQVLTYYPDYQVFQDRFIDDMIRGGQT